MYRLAYILCPLSALAGTAENYRGLGFGPKHLLAGLAVLLLLVVWVSRFFLSNADERELVEVVTGECGDQVGRESDSG